MTSAVKTIDNVVMVCDQTPISPTKTSDPAIPRASRPPAICHETRPKRMIMRVGGTELRAQSKPLST